MHNIAKIRVTNASFFFRPNHIFPFDPRVAFVTTGRLKNCHTSDAFSMIGIRLKQWRLHVPLFNKKKKKTGREERTKRRDALVAAVSHASINI